MKLISPTQHKRFNEVTGFLLLSLGIVILLSLVSYHTQDPSWNTVASARPLNLIGYPGSYVSDLLLQTFGLASFLFPLLAFLLAWKWIRSEDIDAPLAPLAAGTNDSYRSWTLSARSCGSGWCAGTTAAAMSG